MFAKVSFLPVLFLCLGALLPLPGGEWLCKDAAYRLTAAPESAEHAGTIDLDRQLLPVKPENGVRVFADGKPVASRLRANGSLAIAPAPGAREYQIYFGFAEKQPLDQWKPEAGACPPENPLSLTFFPGWQPCTPQQYIDRRRHDYDRRNSWQKSYFPSRARQLLLAQHAGSSVFIPPSGIKERLNRVRRALRELYSRKQNLRNGALGTLCPLPSQLTAPNIFAAQMRNQLSWHLRYIRDELVKHAEQYRRFEKEGPDGPKNELLNINSRRWWRSDRFATDVQLTIRPAETQEYYSARFSGMLQIPETGEYEFELFCNSLTFVKLDGRIFLSGDGDGSAAATSRFAKLKLDAGSHPFELFYRVNTGVGEMLFKMRPAGAEEYRVPGLDDFSPAHTFRCLSLEGRDGKRYPLIARRERYQMFCGKQERLELVRFDFQMPEHALLSYTFGDTLRHTGDEMPDFAALPTDGDPVLVFEAPDYEPLPVHHAVKPEQLVALQPDLSLKLWLPTFLYDDEVFPAELELVSKLPVSLTTEMIVECDDPEASLLKTGRTTVQLPAKADERFNRFTQDVVYKQPLELHGQPLEHPVSYSFKATIPGFTFQETRVRFQPIQLAAGELRFDPVEGLLGAQGEKVIFVLHRPSLAEIRNWELPRKIGRELSRSRKLLIIAEEFGGEEATFSGKLATRLRERGNAVEFLPWHSGFNPLGESMPLLWRELEKSDADQALVVLPCAVHLAETEPWRRDRAIAALLEKLRTISTLRTITLMPFPTDDPAPEYKASLAHLAREYDVRLVEPHCPTAPSSYALPDTPGERSIHPVGVTDELAEILVNSLR